ncbi:glycosyltransferase family 2 protein [Microbacterium elymi]|uniref:Glycosyltransferase n=1 Tax=Microbacterium elymi TaxID=2909587 RepID=A0ABY5NH35_9MICO|nr:glycosyltransferase [Microbacterium elymi]UUT34492.1 glycosyltransferase [Microbacterium elymi]
MLDLSIIVVSYHNAKDLPGLIASIEPAAGDLTWHATIVNNAVDEDLVGLIPGNDNVSVVDSGANLGYSGGINAGLGRAPRARITVFLNPDLALRAGSLTLLVAALDSAASRSASDPGRAGPPTGLAPARADAPAGAGRGRFRRCLADSSGRPVGDCPQPRGIRASPPDRLGDRSGPRRAQRRRGRRRPVGCCAVLHVLGRDRLRAANP